MLQPMQRSWIQRPSVISALCAPIIDSAVERGGNREDLMGRFGLTAASIADLDHRVPITELLAGWTGAMQQTRAPDLPILVGKKATLALYGSLGYAIYTSRSSEESLQRLCRYHDVINNTGRWRIEVTGGRLRMLWRRDGERTLGMRAANEQLVASFATVARQTVGDATTFEEITYTHARPTDTSAHEAHFVCPIRWDALEDSLNLPASFLALVPFGANKLLSSHFLEATDVLLARVPPLDGEVTVGDAPEPRRARVGASG